MPARPEIPLALLARIMKVSAWSPGQAGHTNTCAPFQAACEHRTALCHNLWAHNSTLSQSKVCVRFCAANDMAGAWHQHTSMMASQQDRNLSGLASLMEQLIPHNACLLHHVSCGRHHRPLQLDDLSLQPHGRSLRGCLLAFTRTFWPKLMVYAEGSDPWLLGGGLAVKLELLCSTRLD